jgi:archaellin
MRPSVILVVTADNGAQAVVDLYDNESISYSSNFNSISEFTTRGAFSREFRIPATQNNVDFFGQQYNVNLLNDDTTQINVLRKIDATLSVDTLPIATGHIQFKQAITQQGKMHEFVIAFFGDTVDLARSIGDKLISELDYTDLAHENSYENVNLINDGSLFDLAICYTLTDKGQNWSEDSTVVSRRVFSSVNPIYTGELTLAVQAEWLMDQIMLEAGFAWFGATISKELSKMYIPYVTNPRTQGLSNDEAKFKVDFTADAPFTLNVDDGNGYYSKQLTGWNEVIDPSNSYVSDAYTAQGSFTAGVQINLNIEVDTTGYSANTQHVYDVMLQRVRGGVTDLIPFPDSMGIGPTSFMWIGGTGFTPTTPINPFAVYSSFQLQVEQGDVYTIRIRAHAGSSPNITIKAVNAYTNSIFGFFYVSGLNYAYPVQIDLNAPLMKQIDFLRDILKMFNAVLVPSPNVPNAVEIIPMVEYLSTGDSYDWTSKLDLSKDILLTPASDVRKRLLKWSYKEQSDLINSKYKTGQQRVYGELQLTDAGNDFSTSDYSVELTFGPSPCDLIPNTTIIIPKYFNDTGEFMAPGPRILYRRIYEQSAVVMVYDEVAEEASFTVIPLLSHYKSIPTEIALNDLNFGQEIPPHPIEVMPLHTLFDLYWRQYIAELYDSEQKIMEAYFQLSVTDVFGLKFNDRIWVQDSLWRVIELTDYIVADEQVTKCKLMRLLDLGALCQYTPSTINAETGAVVFEDFEGTESTGSEECCLFYGYTYDDVNKLCYASTGTNGTGGVITSPNTIGKSNITNTSGNQKSATGMGNVNRAEIENNNERILVSGLGHAIAPNNNYSQALGYRNFIRENLEGTAVMGRWAEADVRGVHFGGGTWWDGTSDFGTTIPGRSQHGFIQLMGLGEMAANPTNIDLYLDGVDGGVIEMPTETVWHVNISISVLEYDYNVTDFTGKVATVEFSTMLWRDATTHYSSTPVKISGFQNGFATNQFKPFFPIVSNKIAPYLESKHIGETAVISATIQYTQSKFQRIPII